MECDATDLSYGLHEHIHIYTTEDTNKRNDKSYKFTRTDALPCSYYVLSMSLKSVRYLTASYCRSYVRYLTARQISLSLALDSCGYGFWLAALTPIGECSDSKSQTSRILLKQATSPPTFTLNREFDHQIRIRFSCANSGRFLRSKICPVSQSPDAHDGDV